MPDNPVMAEPAQHRQALAVAAARACLGTPFRHQGRQAPNGLDCVGLLLVAAQALGLSVPSIADYGRLPDRARLPQDLVRAGLRPVPQADRRPADVLLFSVGRWPRHVGLATPIGLIHAWAQVGRVVEHRLSRDWQDRLVTVYRFPGL